MKRRVASTTTSRDGRDHQVAEQKKKKRLSTAIANRQGILVATIEASETSEGSAESSESGESEGSLEDAGANTPEAPTRYPTRGEGDWYSSCGVSPEFEVYHVQQKAIPERIKLLAEIAEKRAHASCESLDLLMEAVGAVSHQYRVTPENAYCDVAAMQWMWELWQDNAGLHKLAQNAWDNLPQDDDGNREFLCPPCFRRKFPDQKYALVNFTRPLHNVKKRTTLAPLVLLGLTWRGFSLSSNARLVREMFECLYTTHRQFFLYIQFWLNADELVDSDMRTEKNNAILQFLYKHLNARVLIIIDTHSRQGNGCLTMDPPGVNCPPGIDDSGPLADIRLPSLLNLCFTEAVHDLILSQRRGMQFDEYTPDPLRGLIICACGDFITNHQQFSDAKKLVDSRQVDFILTFGTHNLYTLDYADGVVSFAVDVFFKNIPPWTARQTCFANKSRMIGILPVLIEAVPLTQNLAKSLKRLDATWVEKWAANEHPPLRKVLKNCNYTTQSSVLALCPSYNSNFGFPLPFCGYCRRTQSVKTTNFDFTAPRIKLICQSCNAKTIYDAPQAGKHYLDGGKVPGHLIWPWPMTLARWDPTITWEKYDTTQTRIPTGPKAPEIWEGEEFASSDVDPSFFAPKKFIVKVTDEPEKSSPTTRADDVHKEMGIVDSLKDSEGGAANSSGVAMLQSRRGGLKRKRKGGQK
ncbi:hypothetical protein FRC03_009112 [Tulasnella sp. 419]|nr:hypothetical protein FRC02_011626 [Tulasnella sp. 418]KAG8958461.1 hypothetical protein FRC03_009112 [Tulasnella sp. 419]